MAHVPYVRVFLSSPGDVTEERQIALEVIERLPNRPAFREKVAFRVIAWDKPGAGTPMRASLTPQEAINQGLPKPSECDIVIVLFWSRMGTPFNLDGVDYLSGTHWEFLDAINSRRSETVVYRRTETPIYKTREDFDQHDQLQTFFKSELFYKKGQIVRGINTYTSPDDFHQKFETDFEQLVLDTIARLTGIAASDREPLPADVKTFTTTLWEGSPFPGLRAFSESDAPIFFGRGVETSELVKRVEASRFVGVIAASGSGKSSLVGAGLIPRLRANAIVSGETGSKDWRSVRFTPGEGESPFAAMFTALCDAFPEHPVSPFLIEQEKDGFINSITHKPAALISICEALLREAKAPVWAEILFFIDQFEELFTFVNEPERAQFIALLEVIYTSRRLRCVMTMRSDFYPNCLELPALAALLKDASYPLTVPTAGALVEMIKRPAERAGLHWDEGLPERIQADTGSEAGALALMAYALDELYHTSHEDKCLTFEAYCAIGKVAGAIGKRAETTFERLELPDKERLLQSVFRDLVSVDERGTATRQRAVLGQFKDGELALVRAFVDARLIVSDDEYVEVAHEAVFRSWTRLKKWIAEAQEDLILVRIDALTQRLGELNPERLLDQEDQILLRQVRVGAAQWVRKGRVDSLLWPAERLDVVYKMILRQKPMLSESERDFIEPEQERLLREIVNIHTDHKRRLDIGDRLAVIGDNRPGVGVKDGVPDILWLPVEVSPDPIIIKTDENEIGPIVIHPFFISKYLVTYAQFQTFLDADDGFTDDRWWESMPEWYKKQAIVQQSTKIVNAPRDSVSWYQCVAFTRWLNTRLHGLEMVDSFGNVMHVGRNAEIRLPLEWEWQWAAQGSRKAQAYPWGEWQQDYANTSEAELNRTTAVGMYPHGAAVCGALDVAGNVFEWCQNDRESYAIINGYSNKELKVLRGGSFFNDRRFAACSYRSNNDPSNRYNFDGFRVLCGPLLASLTSDPLNSEAL